LYLGGGGGGGTMPYMCCQVDKTGERRVSQTLLAKIVLASVRRIVQKRHWK